MEFLRNLLNYKIDEINYISPRFGSLLRAAVRAVLTRRCAFREGCPILPGSSLQKTVVMTPTLENVKGRYGVALEDQFNDKQEPALASSVL
jgi:hypothetical protein